MHRMASQIGIASFPQHIFSPLLHVEEHIQIYETLKNTYIQIYLYSFYVHLFKQDMAFKSVENITFRHKLKTHLFKFAYLP